MDEEIKIIAEPWPDLKVCKFTANRPIHPSSSLTCTNKEMAKDHPLLEKLFELSGVRHIVISGNSVTVATQNAENWAVFGKEVGSTLRRYLLVHGSSQTPSKNTTDSDTVIKSKVEEILRTQINPSVAGHGGIVRLLDVKEGNVYIQMGGGCHGCGQADVTLKQGIEKTIRELLPEVGHVYDTTDHAAGTNPYFAPSNH